MARILRLEIVVCSLLALFLTQEPAFGGVPKDQIQETIERVQQIVNGSVGANDAAQRSNLRDTLMPRFDWTEMAKRSLGKHWEQNSSRQDEFVAAFAEFLGNAYVGKIASYKDERILFVDESIVENLAQVNTKIVPVKGEPMSVNYRLHRAQGDWKIYDVIVEDISLVVNYRSQFNRILSKGSFEDLLKQLRDKESKVRN